MEPTLEDTPAPRPVGAAPPRYVCQRCGNCCRWPGDVHLTDDDIRAIAGFLGMDEDRFIQNHTRVSARRTGLSLLEQTGGACAFLEGDSCRIHPVKPEQCRGFPNRWRFPGWRQVCEAVPVRTADAAGNEIKTCNPSPTR